MSQSLHTDGAEEEGLILAIREAMDRDWISGPRDNASMRSAMAGLFLNYFRNAGFLEVPPEPIVPRDDKSVLFTPATITVLKPLLSQGRMRHPGYIVRQRCLRLQNLKKMDDPMWVPEYMSHFNMVGALAAVDAGAALSGPAGRFLALLSRAAGREIQLAGAAKDSDLIKQIAGWSRFALWTNLPRGMTWNYGVEGLAGRGVDVRLRQRDGAWASVGQMVQLSYDGNPVGYEFGFGVETLLARTIGIGSPFLVSELCDGTDADLSRAPLVDLISILAVLYANGIRSGHDKRQSIARKVLRLLPMHCERCNAGFALVTERCIRYCAALGGEAHLTQLRDDLIASHYRFTQASSRLEAYGRNQIHLVKIGAREPERALADLEAYAAKSVHVRVDVITSVLNTFRDAVETVRRRDIVSTSSSEGDESGGGCDQNNSTYRCG